MARAMATRFCIPPLMVLSSFASARFTRSSNSIALRVRSRNRSLLNPEYQGAGYGKKLIKFTLKKAKELGYPAVVITGKPEYYEKFGFKPASKYNIFYEGMENKENPFFMVKVLDKHKMKGIYGIYTDPDVYTVNQEEVEQFDKKFPKRKKKEREMEK